MNTQTAASPWVHCTVDGRSVRVAAGTSLAAALAHGGDGVARELELGVVLGGKWELARDELGVAVGVSLGVDLADRGHR